MKILHITNNYPTDNYPIFGVFVKEQINSLTNEGVESDVFFINGREKGKLEYLKAIFRLRRFLRYNRYDIIHCHHALSAVCLILSGSVRNKKIITSYQNDPLHEQGYKLHKFIKKKFNAIILKNNSHIVDGNSVFYQPNGVNTNFFKTISRQICLTELNLSNDKIYLLFVSSNFIREQKRYDKFQQVLHILKDNYKFDNIEELKLINTKRELVPYYFNAASVHLLTSDFEGSPNSVKEAMACNLPVVATNVGNVAELLKNVNGSFVSQSHNPEELAELVYKALTEKTENNGREQLIAQGLDIELVAKNLISIYNKIIN